MTCQRSHTVMLAGGAYVLCEQDGGPLFDPRQHGARIVAFTSAAPHGYRCGYGVSAGRLSLASLQTSLHSSVRELPMLGPVTSIETAGAFSHVWTDLAVPIRFTGSLLVGRRSKRERGWWGAAMRHEEVQELTFDDGRLLDQTDVSDLFARLRGAYEAIHAESADAEAAIRSLIESPTGLTGDYGLVEDLRAAWERDVQVRANEARRAARAAAHERLPKRDQLAVQLASRPLLRGQKDGAWLEGTCPRCSQSAKLRVCLNREMVVCYPCYWEL